MAYNKKNKVYIIKKILFIIICIVCIVIILSAGFGLYRNLVPEEVSNIAGGSNSIQSKTVAVARAKLGMKQGELLYAGRVEMVEVPFELVPEGAVKSLSKLDNMRLKRDISEKEFLNVVDLMPKEAAYEDGDRLIEHNFSEGAVPASVSEGSAIDIKLFVKDGSDSTVISKAVVISRSGNLLSFYMDGREQEFIKEAAAEGMLFAVQYIDISQKASEVTYIPSYENRRE